MIDLEEYGSPTEGHNCIRLISPSKYEHKDPATYDWWLRLFDCMENEIKIPPERRKSVLKMIFPDQLLRKVVSLVSLSQTEIVSVRTNSASMIRSTQTIELMPKEPSVVDEEDGEYTPIEDSEVEQTGAEEEKESESETSSEVEVKAAPKAERPKKFTVQKNPYRSFVRGNPERVAVWYELPPLSLEGMNLNDKANALTELIAVDFVNWIRKLGGEDSSSLTVPQIVKMFEIGFNIHAATAVQCLVNELPSITRVVAEGRNVPERWTGKMLHTRIREDLAQFRRKKILRAFNTTVGHELRYVPPKFDHTRRWLEIKAPEKLVTMSFIWNGITQMRCTREYCKWLIDNPQFEAPKYLRSVGMLDPNYYLQPHYSVESLTTPQLDDDAAAAFLERKGNRGIGH